MQNKYYVLDIMIDIMINENKRQYTLILTLIWFQIVKEKRKSRFSLCPLNGAIHSFLIARFFAAACVACELHLRSFFLQRSRKKSSD